MAKKDAMGQEVDSLYLSLGLNVADLEMGFQTAGQTVRQAMSRLNSEANQIRLKADIDVTRLEAAGKSVEALKAREKALNDELAVQQKKLEILNRAYQANAKTYGTDHSLTRGVDTKRLYQLRDIERLKAQIAQVNGELAKTATASTSALGTLANGFNTVTGKVTGTVGAIGKLNTAITGVVAGITAGAGIFALTDKAMKAGNDLYKLSTRLHTTTAEASQLSKVFQLSGTDINSVIPLFARLDKQALAAAKTQNSLSQAMAEFGFTLTDDKGNLLGYQQQLAQLAKGYQNAVKAGRETEFVTQALGAKGAALVPLLQDYATNMEIISRIKTTGLLNPKEAHELYIEWQAMQMQAAQLTGAIGQAMMPIAKEMMPEITQGFADCAKLIAENKEGIKEFGTAAGDVIGGLAKAVVSLTGALGDLKKAWNDISGLGEDEKIIRANGGGAGLDKSKIPAIISGVIGGGMLAGIPGAIVGGIGMSFLGEDAAILGAKAGIRGKDWENYEYLAQKKELERQELESKKALEKQKQELTRQTVGESVKLEEDAAKVREELETNLAKATSEKLKEQLEAIKDKVEASVAEGKTEAAAWVSVADDIKKAMKAAAKEAQEANKALTRSIAGLSMSDLGKSLYGVDTAAEDTLKKGADPGLVAQEAALKKGKIMQQFEKETAEYLDGIYADSLTKRLNQIEREKKAWIQKGMDEVTATRAAEAQKQQAVNDSIKNMFTSQKKYLDIYRQAMRGQTMGNNGMYDFTQSQGNRQQNAIRALRAAMMQEAGVNPWERTTMAEVQGFQQAMKSANEWGSSLLKDGGGMANVANAITQSNSEVTNILGQISPEVSQANSNLSSILTAVQSRQNATPQITVSPSINVNLGGAYVFDNTMKKQLTDDITNQVSNAVTDAVRDATNRVNTSFSN
ncbi:hypothetical protein SELR_11370 [Selenomonas ruminantium subsp. lactilytica TAM6421]|uniref:Uncharacterized protein n=1 Tax=Selenomonas ruminantium subsp. lactilytica (strain NBRC 103574 / TAM6421) TaxID=927704 RepID=I0GQ08_SELRL|nr:hypothetical protein [Selenomonas ruminantium]BAL82845.1 hypothetical protein SELR_11370 [Selenomonas ruminantium subsp. lactilytica TAM6421]